VRIPKPVQSAWDAGERAANGFGCLPLASLVTGLAVCVGAVLLRPSYTLAAVLASAVICAYVTGRTAWHGQVSDLRRRRDTAMRMAENLAADLTAERARGDAEVFAPPGDPAAELTMTMPAIGAEELNRRV
jgi:hypothetical protein